MLSFCVSPSEISLVLELSDARWLSEEMSFLAELYRSKAESSERQFGGDNNAALTAFLETESKCVQLSVALQTTLRRGFPRKDHGHRYDHGRPSDHPVAAASVIDLPNPILARPNHKISSTSAAAPSIKTKRVGQTVKQRRATRENDPSPRGGRRSKAKRVPAG
jgi:hypothetical protein